MLLAKATIGNRNMEIHSDDDAPNPRLDWDHLGSMVTWHRDYNLGEIKTGLNPREFWEEYHLDDAIVLPLFLYDHSGITMSTSSFSDPWDSGQVGWIYVSKVDVRKEYGWKNITKKREQQIREHLKLEVEEFDTYITGGFWFFMVEVDGVIEESFGGFSESNYQERLKEELPTEYHDLIEALEEE